MLQGDSDGVPTALAVYRAIPDRVEQLLLFGFAATMPLVPDSSCDWPPDAPEPS